jgi:23S rRNA (cytosine1962-C5)-methyltransferase
MSLMNVIKNRFNPMFLPLLSELPGISEKRIAVNVNAPAQRLLRSCHPWLFESSITKISHNGKSGDLAVIFDNKKKFLAIGLYDPASPIRVRIFASGKGATINHAWFINKISEAHEKRSELLSSATNGYRVVSGENDGLPGLVIDRYADTLVIKIYTPAWIPHLHDVATALLKVLPLQRIVLRMNKLTQAQTPLLHGLTNGIIIYGDKLDGVVVFKENGILFEADPILGQKTGFFLDQRDNRARVEKISRGKDVLNVFSYTGGFSLYAARGGAASVTSLDISKPAIAGSVRNFSLNSDNLIISTCRHNYLAEDAFKAMENLAAAGKKFGVVIIDPPSFAKKADEIPRALKAYSRLVKLGLNLLKHNGILVMASCSSRVKADDFFSMIFETAKSAQYSVKELERSTHAIDHPIGFPEGAYLKCLFLKVRGN